MKGKINWPLLVFYCSIEGWVIAFPLYGPVLGPLAAAHGAKSGALATTFLFFFAISFAIWGFILQKKSMDKNRLRMLVVLTIGACFVLSLSLLVAPVSWWRMGFAGFGIFASLPSLVWLDFVSHGLNRKQIGWNLGVTGVFVEMIAYVEGMLGQYGWHYVLFWMVQLLPALAIIILLSFPDLFDPPVPHISSESKPQIPVDMQGRPMESALKGTFAAVSAPALVQRRQALHAPFLGAKPAPARWALYLFIFAFPLVGGIMYDVVQPLFLASYPRVFSDYGNLPYILTMPVAGYLADRKNIRPVALYGLASLGVSYTVFVLSTSLWAAFVGDTFLHVGFAFMDLFVLFVLAWYAPAQQTPLYIGGGLAVYIFSILAGTWLSNLIVPHTTGDYHVVYLMAILIMFVSFFLLEWIVRMTDAAELQFEAIGEDLVRARGVQDNLLPQLEDAHSEWEISYALELAREVGGDFFDIIVYDESRRLLVIGDVMGKGLPAAMLVSSVLGQIRSLADSVASLPGLLRQLNRVLIRDVRLSMYVTVGLVLIDGQRQTITYASAGHMPPYVLHDSGVRTLDKSFLPLGTDLEVDYDATETEFIEGDLLFMYTDGVVEAQNKRKELYGFERLEHQISLCTGLSAQAAKDAIARDLQEFGGDVPLADDYTLLVLKAPNSTQLR